MSSDLFRRDLTYDEAPQGSKNEDWVPVETESYMREAINRVASAYGIVECEEITPTCEEKPTWNKGDESDFEMMRRIERNRRKRRRYLGALHKAARKIREERRPKTSTRLVEVIN